VAGSTVISQISDLRASTGPSTRRKRARAFIKASPRLSSRSLIAAGRTTPPPPPPPTPPRDVDLTFDEAPTDPVREPVWAASMSGVQDSPGRVRHEDDALDAVQDAMLADGPRLRR